MVAADWKLWEYTWLFPLMQSMHNLFLSSLSKKKYKNCKYSSVTLQKIAFARNLQNQFNLAACV